MRHAQPAQPWAAHDAVLGSHRAPAHLFCDLARDERFPCGWALLPRRVILAATSGACKCDTSADVCEITKHASIRATGEAGRRRENDSRFPGHGMRQLSSFSSSRRLQPARSVSASSHRPLRPMCGEGRLGAAQRGGVSR